MDISQSPPRSPPGMVLGRVPDGFGKDFGKGFRGIRDGFGMIFNEIWEDFRSNFPRRVRGGFWMDLGRIWGGLWMDLGCF